MFVQVFYLLVICFCRHVLAEPEEIDESIQPSTITFNRSETNGLMWPLPDWGDAGILLMHSTHCVRMVYNYDVNDLSEINFMHGNHCAEVVKHYISFFSHWRDYSVQDFICKDTRNLTRPKRASPGSYGYFRYRKRRNVYNTQNDMQFFEGSNNFGILLLKQWRNVKLTEAEKNYLEQMKLPQTIRMGALGIYCNYGADTNIVLHTLAQYLDEFRRKVLLQKSRLTTIEPSEVE